MSQLFVISLSAPSSVTRFGSTTGRQQVCTMVNHILTTLASIFSSFVCVCSVCRPPVLSLFRTVHGSIYLSISTLLPTDASSSHRFTSYPLRCFADTLPLPCLPFLSVCLSECACFVTTLSLHRFSSFHFLVHYSLNRPSCLDYRHTHAPAGSFCLWR